MNEYESYFSRLQANYEPNDVNEVLKPKLHLFRIDKLWRLAISYVHPNFENVLIPTWS